MNLQIFANSFWVVIAFVLFGYFFSRIFKRNDLADVFWGLGFVSIAIVNSFENPPNDLRSYFILIAVITWGTRLSLYIANRNLSKNEDVRYANWRKEWGKSEPVRTFFQVFLLQGVILGIISTPVTWGIQIRSSEFNTLNFFGAFLFLAGFFTEAIADSQMHFFKRNPKNAGKVMRAGLWSRSRHPNYFGEILVWWGIFLMMVNLPYGYACIVSPLLITYLLMKVSGVTMLERLMENKNEEYKAYQKEVPALLPRFNRKKIT